MAQLGENEHPLTDNGERIIDADLGTTTAEGTLSLIHHWNRDSNRLLTTESRPEQNMGIRFLDIAVKKLYSFLLTQG